MVILVASSPLGLQGALSPLQNVGDIVIADRSVSGSEIWRCDNRWRVALAAHLTSAHHGSLAGSDVILESPTTKAALFEASGGALAVDMESQVAARFALKRQVRLGALRVISDDAGHVLPPAALVAMTPDGGIALGRVLWSLAKNPLQIGALIRTARSANRAFAGISLRLPRHSVVLDFPARISDIFFSTCLGEDEFPPGADWKGRYRAPSDPRSSRRASGSAAFSEDV